MMGRASAANKVAYALLASVLVHGAIAGAVGRGIVAGTGGAAETAQSHALDARLELATETMPRAVAEAKDDSHTLADAATQPGLVPTQSAATVPSALIAVPTPYYYPAAELDRRPHPITPVNLDEPGREMSEGYLILRLLISENGGVDDVVVVLDDAEPLLLRTAREAFGRARYAPGMKNGAAVKSEMMIEVKLAREPT